jgi:hypothetical protein
VYVLQDAETSSVELDSTKVNAVDLHLGGNQFMMPTDMATLLAKIFRGFPIFVKTKGRMLSRKKNHALSFPNILKFTRGKQLHIQS